MHPYMGFLVKRVELMNELLLHGVICKLKDQAVPVLLLYILYIPVHP